MYRMGNPLKPPPPVPMAVPALFLVKHSARLKSITSSNFPFFGVSDISDGCLDTNEAKKRRSLPVSNAIGM